MSNPPIPTNMLYTTLKLTSTQDVRDNNTIAAFQVNGGAIVNKSATIKNKLTVQGTTTLADVSVTEATVADATITNATITDATIADATITNATILQDLTIIISSIIL